jgi:hypothetical protein
MATDHGKDSNFAGPYVTKLCLRKVLAAVDMNYSEQERKR